MAKTNAKKLVKDKNKKIKSTKKTKKLAVKKTRTGTKKKNNVPIIVSGIILLFLVCVSLWFFVL